MYFQDYRVDARRVYETLLKGGIGIIPTDVGYVILGVTGEAIWKIFRVKRRKPEKLNAMCGCMEMHRNLHLLDEDARAVVSAIVGDANLPMGTVAPPPNAWITRAETTHSKSGATATNRDPIANSTSAAWNIRTRP